MGELFHRRASVIIQPPGDERNPWENLRISFEVGKTIDTEPNKGTVTIYNLSRESRNRIQQKRDILILKVAYRNRPFETLYIGEIRFVSHRKEGAEWLTVCECGDGDSALNQLQVSNTFGPGTTIVQVFESLRIDLINSLAPIGYSVSSNFNQVISSISGFATSDENTEPLTSTGVFSKGITLFGTFGSIINELAGKLGIDVFFNNLTLYALKKNETLGLDPIYLTPRTGLIGSPRALEDGGYAITALITPDFIPGRKITFETVSLSRQRVPQLVTGMKINRIDFSGDTWEQQWYADCEVSIPSLGLRSAA